MPKVSELLDEMNNWPDQNAFCSPGEFAEMLSRSDTALSVANQELMQGPNGGHISKIIQTLFYVSLETDEGRSLAFNVVYRSIFSHPAAAIGGEGENAFDGSFRYWRFETARPFTVQEIRRLAACNPETSAIWIELSGDNNDPTQLENAKLEIMGVALLGHKWMDSIQSFSEEDHNHETPLILRIEAPGWLDVYNGSSFFARLKGGAPHIALPPAIKNKNVLNFLVKDGLKEIQKHVNRHNLENPQQTQYFEEYSYYSVILTIVNNMQRLRHGGALIISSMGQKQTALSYLNIKYSFHPDEHLLREFFVEYANIWHQHAGFKHASANLNLDSAARKEKDELLSYHVKVAYKKLVEACQLVGGFASTDGAILLDTSLNTMGFSSEILLEEFNAKDLEKGIHRLSGHLIESEQLKNKEAFNLKHLGMRHRSAAKLCTILKNAAIFVVSQDGGVSLMWNKNDQVYFWEDFRTKNMPFELSPTLFTSEDETEIL